MAFGTLSQALANAGVVTQGVADLHHDRIKRADADADMERRRAASKRGEERRRARKEREAGRRSEAVSHVAARTRASFDRTGAAVVADDIVKVRGVWVWRKGAHRGKPVSAKALAKRHIW
jgi:hypothetical protein